MTVYLKQSTSSQEIPLGYFVSDTDGNTPETSLTIANTDIKIWKTGATSLADKNSGGATHIADGIYYCTLDATDTNTLGPMIIFIHVADALAVRVPCVVLTANVYDSLIGGTDLLEIDLTQIGGDAQSATDLKDFADAGYDPSTNKVQGVVLTDTVTTYTGNTPQTGDSFARLGAPAGASVSADVAAVKSQTAAIETDTQDIQSRIPAALVSGRIDASVGAMASNTLTASALATDAVTEIQSGLATSSALATTDGKVDSILTDTGTTIPAQISGLNNLSSTDVEDAVWDATMADHLISGSTGAALNAAGAAGDPWSTSLPGAYGAGTAGYIIGTNIDGTISSRAAQTTLDDIQNGLFARINTASAGASGSITLDGSAPTTSQLYRGSIVTILSGAGAGQSRNIIDYSSGRVATIVPNWAVAPDNTSVYGIYMPGSVNLNTWRYSQPNNLVASSYIPASVESVSNNTTAADNMQLFFDGTGYAGGTTPLNVNVTSMAANTITASALASDAVTEIQNGLSTLTAAQVNTEVDTALSDVGLTTTITGRIDAAISTRLASASYTAPDNAGISSIESVTDKLDTAMVLDGSVYQFTANALELAPTGGGITPEDVWTYGTRVLTAGTNIVLAKGTGITGLNDLSAAQVNAEVDTALSDVGLTTTITGRIDASISSRMATFSYTAPDNAGIAAVQAKTDQLTFTPAGIVNANVQYVNDIQVAGTGTEGNEWGPV
jgi:hypothetical protein